MSLAFYADLFGLEGQTAVVLGGSSVVGGVVAEALARAGAVIVVAGRSEARGHACVERIRSCGGAAGFRAVDLAETGAAQTLLDFALGEHGTVDLLVNSASLLWRPDWIDTSCQVFADAMADQAAGGAVLNVVPNNEIGDQAAACAARLADRSERSHVRLNTLRLDGDDPAPSWPAADLVGPALLLLSRESGRRLNGCDLLATTRNSR